MLKNLSIVILSTSLILVNAQDTGVLVRTHTAQQRSIQIKGIYAAEILPFRKATVAAEWNGPIIEILAQEYDAVIKGQVLAQMDTEILAKEIEESEAQLIYSEKQWNRYQGLHEKKAIADSALILAERDYKIADATLQRLRIQFQKATIRAPWDGVIQKKQVEVGDYMVPGQPAFGLVDKTQYRVRALVSGKDTLTMETGKTARLVLQNSNEIISTHISKIAPILDSTTRSLEVEAIINPKKDWIRPGMVAQLEIDRETIEAALCIPLSAVLEFEDGKGVYIAKDGHAVQRRIVPSEIIDEMLVVREGLLPGDQVIVEGQTQVSNGSKITTSTPEQEGSTK